MERPKIRETDKARWFSLSAFFLEFFNTKWRRKDISKIPEAEIEKAVGSVSCMVDPTTVGYVSARMALTVDDKVGYSAVERGLYELKSMNSHRHGKNFIVLSIVSYKL